LSVDARAISFLEDILVHANLAADFDKVLTSSLRTIDRLADTG
jgi:hypothetical protein